MKLIIIVATTLCLSGMVIADTVGYATYFTKESCIREGTSGITASGKPLNDGAMWCALPFRPARWGQRYRVTNLKSKQSIVVMHMDRGPSKHCVVEHGVIIDLTESAMRLLTENDTESFGRVKVKIERIK